MTLRKFLFLNTSEYGYVEEAPATDSLELGGLTMSGAIAMGANKITGLANGTDATDAINKSQLDAAIAGLHWKEPVQVLKLKSDADQSGTPPTATTVGEAWLVNNWGEGYTNGDIVEWSGSAWVVVTPGASSEPPDNTRAVIIGTGAAGSFAGHANAEALYDADTDTWSFVAASDGDALLVNGDGSVFANTAFTYDTTSKWIQFTGPNSIPDATSAVGGGIKGKLTVNSATGLLVTSGVLTMELTADAGLQFTGSTAKTLGAKVNNAQAIHTDSDGLGLSIDTGYGLEFSSNNLHINLEAANTGTGGLKFAASGDVGAVGVMLPSTNPGLKLTSDGLDAKLKSNSGLAVDADGLYVVVNDAAGITVDGSGVALVLGTNPGLEFDVDGKLQAKPNTAQGLHTDEEGLGVSLTAAGTGTGGLEFDTNGAIQIELESSKALALSSNGLGVVIDDTTIGINGSNQLYVKGAGDSTRVSYLLTAGTGGIGKGHAVYISAADTVLKADKDAALTAAAIGVAAAAITAGNTGSIVFSGIAPGVLSSATPGAPYFVTDNGVISETIPAGASYVRRVGYAINTTDLLVMVGEPMKKLA